MRKAVTSLLAIALLVGFSGLAWAGGGDGFCAYSHKKLQADKTDKTKPVASKTDKADDGKPALAVADKTQKTEAKK